MYSFTCPQCKITKQLVARPRGKLCHKCRCTNPRGTKFGEFHCYTEGYKLITGGGLAIKEHRLIMEQHLGRKLKHYEIVHHKDGNKLNNNNISNLEVMTQGEHMKEHANMPHRLSQPGKLECYRCKVFKQFNEFTLRANRKLGIQGVCKQCLRKGKNKYVSPNT